MQRAATANSSPSTPSNESPSKRMRLSNGTASTTTPSSTHAAVRAALAVEEEQRIRALEKHVADSGETRWVLSVQDTPRIKDGLHFVTAGFGDIDRLDDDDATPAVRQLNGTEGEEERTSGRRVFGKMKRPARPAKDYDEKDASDSGSSASNSGSEDQDPAAQLIREARRDAAARKLEDLRSKRKGGSEQQARVDENRRPKKEINLNKLTGISSGRGRSGLSSSSSTPRNGADIACFSCGEIGHRKSECPIRRRRDEDIRIIR